MDFFSNRIKLMSSNIDAPRQYLATARETQDNAAIRSLVVRAGRELPKTPEAFELFSLAFGLLSRIEDAREKRLATLDFVREVPFTPLFKELYSKVMEAAVVAADSLDEANRRTTELMRIAEELPKTDDFMPLRLLAWRLALGLPDRPRFAEPNLPKIAHELPKQSDISFFASYTLLGIARSAPKEGPFEAVYREAIELAIKAANILEPYYRRYALIAIHDELPKDGQFGEIGIKALEEAFKATMEMADEFAREFCLIELFQLVPRRREFYPLLQNIMEQALSFFTVRKWMEDVDVLDVVDYVLSAEEQPITDSKKNRFSREKYAQMLSKELEKFGSALNDTRFVETLRPYTHVWVRPKELRESVKKVVDRLESLKNIYHGAEVERPVFIAEEYTGSAGALKRSKDAVQPGECISIDLGATNTVVMRKKKDEAPDFIHLGNITRHYDSICIVPTLLSPDTNNIGAEAAGGGTITNIKQMLLEGSPRGRENMERFIRILHQHLKKATVSSGWFALKPRNAADVVYITVPVGYQDYSSAIKSIAGKIMKGTKIELIEEPLAAAAGYQVVDEKDKLVMVIDFGGSTLNTMLLRLNVNEVNIVAKPERALMLGGQDIDLWLAEFLSAKAGLANDAGYNLKLAAEELKIKLSERKETPFIWDGRELLKITRDDLEELLEEKEFYKAVDRTILNVLKRAEKVGLKKERIEAILLTGGSSQIPSFKDKIGDIFPELRIRNLIYDHSPLTAVGMGAAFYGTRDVTDRHLAVAYALRYAPHEKDVTHSYCIVLEKGEQLPLEKSFRMTPARKLGEQKEITIELFEVPESLLVRRWIVKDGVEFLKQDIKEAGSLALAGLKPITLSFGADAPEEVRVTFCVTSAGEVALKYGLDGKTVETGIKLQ